MNTAHFAIALFSLASTVWCQPPQNVVSTFTGPGMGNSTAWAWHPDVPNLIAKVRQSGEVYVGHAGDVNAPTLFTLPTTNIDVVKWGDFNGDGWDDLVFGNSAGSWIVFGPLLSNPTIIAIGEPAKDLDVKDINGDGHDDVVGGYSNGAGLNGRGWLLDGQSMNVVWSHNGTGLEGFADGVEIVDGRIYFSAPWYGSNFESRIYCYEIATGALTIGWTGIQSFLFAGQWGLEHVGDKMFTSVGFGLVEFQMAINGTLSVLNIGLGSSSGGVQRVFVARDCETGVDYGMFRGLGQEVRAFVAGSGGVEAFAGSLFSTGPAFGDGVVDADGDGKDDFVSMHTTGSPAVDFFSVQTLDTPELAPSQTMAGQTGGTVTYDVNMPGQAGDLRYWAMSIGWPGPAGVGGNILGEPINFSTLVPGPSPFGTLSPTGQDTLTWTLPLGNFAGLPISNVVFTLDSLTFDFNDTNVAVLLFTQ